MQCIDQVSGLYEALRGCVDVAHELVRIPCFIEQLFQANLQESAGDGLVTDRVKDHEYHSADGNLTNLWLGVLLQV